MLKESLFDGHFEEDLIVKIQQIQAQFDTKQDQTNQQLARISRYIITKVARFMYIDLYDPRTEVKTFNQVVDHSDCQSKDGCLSYLARREFLIQLTRPKSLLYLCAFLLVSVSLVNQYYCDVQILKLNHLNSSTIETNKSSQIEIQEMKVRLARQRLDVVGAPFVDTNFGIEFLHLHILLVSVVSYFQSFMRTNMNIYANFPLGRLIIHPERECQQYSKLIVKECVNFISSSCNFVRGAHSLSQLIDPELVEGRGSPTSPSKDLSGLSEDHREASRRLYEMASSGALQQPNWVNLFNQKAGRYYGLYFMALFVYNLIMFISVGMLFEAAVKQRPRSGPMDVMVNLSVAVLFVYETFGVVYFNSFVLFDSLEKIHHTNSLIELLGCVIQSNSEMMMASLDERKSRNVIRNEMNANLLLGLMHYKLFVSQSDNTKNELKLVTVNTTFLFFLMPAGVRLHVPYMNHGAFKYIGIVWSLLTVSMTNFVLVPVCYYHSRSLTLYKMLNSLMAHTVETNDIYYDHLVWLIHKELNHPEILITRFATKWANFDFTYPNLVKIHFWFGIIILSIVSGITSNNETFFNYFLSDPFGLLPDDVKFK